MLTIIISISQISSQYIPIATTRCHRKRHCDVMTNFHLQDEGGYKNDYCQPYKVVGCVLHREPKVVTENWGNYGGLDGIEMSTC